MNRKKFEKENEEESSLTNDKLKNEQNLSDKKETFPEKASELKKEKVVEPNNKSENKEVKKIVQLETEITNLKKEKLLLLAEIDNQQKNFQKQILESYKYNNQRIIKRILDFLVELEEIILKPARSENSKEAMFKRLQDELTNFSIKKDKDNKIDELTKLVKELKEKLVQEKKSYLEGMEIARDNLWRTLESEGVKEMEIKIGSDKWNSRFHVFGGKKEDNKIVSETIIEVVEKGYLLYDRVIRPAKVIISKSSEN